MSARCPHCQAVLGFRERTLENCPVCGRLLSNVKFGQSEPNPKPSEISPVRQQASSKVRTLGFLVLAMLAVLLGTFSPLALYIAGIIVGLVFWKRHSYVSLFAILGFVFLTMAHLVLAGTNYWILITAVESQHRGGRLLQFATEGYSFLQVSHFENDDRIQTFQALVIARMACKSVGIFFLIMSIFGWRNSKVQLNSSV